MQNKRQVTPNCCWLKATEKEHFLRKKRVFSRQQYGALPFGSHLSDMRYLK